jgi:hypothetical protein
VRNVAAASNAALRQDVQTLQAETEKLQKELESVLVQFHDIQQEADLVEHEVVDEVCALREVLVWSHTLSMTTSACNTVHDWLFNAQLWHVQVRARMQALKEDLFEKVSMVLDSTVPTGESGLGQVLAGRWNGVLEKAARFWARAGSSGSSTRDDLQLPLQDLHRDIHESIDAEVCLLGVLVLMIA